MSNIVAIHQPNFFPWLGYFDKISRSDVFIFLDDVQFPKTGGVWCNRVKLLVGAEAKWLTAPVDRSFNGVRNVNQMVFSDKENWRKRALNTIAYEYRRAAFFDETYSLIEPLILFQENNIARYNIHTIKSIVSAVGLSATLLKNSSELITNSVATQRLIDLTKCMDGDTYLCGGGAADYQQDDMFSRFGINLEYQKFHHPTYSQSGASVFFSGLSVIDALMNLGLDGVKEIFNKKNNYPKI